MAKTSEEIRTEIRTRIAELTEREPDEISDAASFIDELGIDSLMAIELMVALDKEYKIDISEDEFRNIQNLDQAVDVVTRYVNDDGEAA